MTDPDPAEPQAPLTRLTAPVAAGKRPLRLQTRLMAAVIGFVSLILVIVAVATSATLGTVLGDRLDEQLRRTAQDVAAWTSQRFIGSPDDFTAAAILGGHPVYPGTLLAVAANPSVLNAAPSGAVVEGVAGSGTARLTTLTEAQLTAIDQALRQETPMTTMTLEGLGSYRVLVTQTPIMTYVVGLPRAETQQTMTRLFTTLATTTLGGLILLALTTAITIRVGLRPLRTVARTATRVATQPLDQGTVSITERVPAAEADPRTETGLVGSALNTLLDHVDSSLAARARNEERMRQFVADASHELRTPLASIRGYSELSLRALQQDPAGQGASESTAAALERIQAQSVRMTHLVEDLLLLARLDEGRELVYSPVDLTRLAVEGVADARPTGPDHHWSLEVPEEEVPVIGDAGRLHQVVANLLANARTHTPAGSAITLSLAVEPATGEGPGAAVLRVHDDGPGIDPALREELFSRFARGDASRARQTGGTGLGLAIVKAIVEAHHGTISVQSAPGDTTFTVRLPLR